MAKKNGSEATALATTTEDALASRIDELDLETDGLDDLEPEDIKIAARVLNFKGTDEAGEPIPTNAYYDTITEQTHKQMTAVLLTMTKSNEFRVYDEAEGRSKVRCRSFDRKTGTMEDGTQRPCQGCPDAQWRAEGGKRTRNCGPVVNLVAVDKDTQAPFILRCKRTGLPPWQQYLNRYFLGRRIGKGGKRGHWPLFAFETQISAKMSDDKKYALPVFQRGEALAEEELILRADEAKFYREVVMPVLQKVSDQENDATDTNSSAAMQTRAEDFSDDDTQPAQPADGSRF